MAWGSNDNKAAASGPSMSTVESDRAVLAFPRRNGRADACMPAMILISPLNASTYIMNLVKVLTINPP